MKINVKYVLPDPGVSWNDLSGYMSCISEDRRQRIARFAFEKDRIASLLAELLIRHEVMTALGLANTAIQFSYHPFGKPFLEGFSDYHFSISHTDGCVAFAGCDKPVGIDVEKIAAYDPKIAGRFFDSQEAQWIAESAHRDSAFFDIWTKKEAYLKMIGTGLSKPLQSFNVLSDELKAGFTTKKISKHMMTVCSADASSGNEDVFFREMQLSRLLETFDKCEKRVAL